MTAAHTCWIKLQPSHKEEVLRWSGSSF